MTVLNHQVERKTIIDLFLLCTNWFHGRIFWVVVNSYKSVLFFTRLTSLTFKNFQLALPQILSYSQANEDL